MGQIFAQILDLPNVSLSGQIHDLVYFPIWVKYQIVFLVLCACFACLNIFSVKKFIAFTRRESESPDVSMLSYLIGGIIFALLFSLVFSLSIDSVVDFVT